jgi:hypothetical protein
VTFEELVVILATKTGMSREEWADFFTLTLEQQMATAQAYARASWVLDGNLFAEILAILLAAAQVGGAVAGVVSGAQAIQSLKAA